MSEFLHECFVGIQELGVLIWRQRPIHHFACERAMKITNKRCAGKTAGCMGTDGYLRVRFNEKSHLVHRIVWELFNGPIPDGMQIDHVNHNRSDNRISNLRLVTKKDNLKNKSRSSINTTGESGISFRKDLNKFMARISIDGHRRGIGCFDTIDEAIHAREKALAELGFHKNHGRNSNEI